MRVATVRMSVTFRNASRAMTAYGQWACALCLINRSRLVVLVILTTLREGGREEGRKG